jgi:hypothetical protein
MKPTAHMTLNLMPLAIRRAISDGKSNDPIAMASLRIFAMQSSLASGAIDGALD